MRGDGPAVQRRRTMTNDHPAGSGPGALFTDLYELTMFQAYAAEDMTAPAVFELFFRQLPADRTYVMAAGLDDVLDYIEGLRFTADDLAWLQQQHFNQAFLQT